MTLGTSDDTHGPKVSLALVCSGHPAGLVRA